MMTSLQVSSFVQQFRPGKIQAIDDDSTVYSMVIDSFRMHCSSTSFTIISIKYSHIEVFRFVCVAPQNAKGKQELSKLSCFIAKR